MKRTLVALPNGDVVDAIVGMRSWRLTMESGVPTLRSVYLASTDGFHGWPHDKPLKSKCFCRGSAGLRKDGSLVPGACQGTCGIYSWSDEFFAIEPVATRSWLRTEILVHGEVYLWGKVRVHERGYRSEYAKVAALWDVPSTDGEAIGGQAQFAALAAKRYGAMLTTVPLWIEGRTSPSKQSTTGIILGEPKVSLNGDALDVARAKLRLDPYRQRDDS